jgi:hypothetical protein
MVGQVDNTDAGSVEVAVAKFEVLSLHLPGLADGKRENRQGHLFESIQ